MEYHTLPDEHIENEFTLNLLIESKIFIVDKNNETRLIEFMG